MTLEEEDFALLLDFAELLEDFALLLDTLVSLLLDCGVTLLEDFADSLDFGATLLEDFVLLLDLLSVPEQDEGLDPSLPLRMTLLDDDEGSSSRGAKLLSSSPHATKSASANPSKKRFMQIFLLFHHI